MDTQRIQVERMRFLFISDPNTFATYTCGFPIRSCAITLSAITLIISIAIAVLSVETYLFDCFVILSVYWLVMLSGPFVDNIDFLWKLIYISMAAIYIQVFSYIALLIYLLTREVSDKSVIIAISLAFYMILEWVSIYAVYSYVKSEGLGLLPREVSQDNSQCMNFIQQTDARCQIPATSLRVEQNPTIVLTNSVDLAFVSDKQGLTVDGVVLPSGLVVPSGGHGKNWKVVGNIITLF
jgi:hypothetical protein